MAEEIFIVRRCPKCLGTKIVPEEIGGDSGDVCDICHGEGTVSWDSLDLSDLMDSVADVLDKCNDILDKCDDILEAVSA